jgi:DNA-directed RNA polymerase specialized sigma subunit
MTTYTAHCDWDGYNWVASVEELPGAFTQAKRLELIPSRVVEVVKLMNGDVITSQDVKLVRRLAGGVAEDAEEVARLRSDLEDIQRSLSERQPRLIRALRSQGLTVRDIGKIVGLSPQRVQQVLHAQEGKPKP